MCLTVDRADKAKKPIKCYKVLMELRDEATGEVITITPFRQVVVHKNILSRKEEFVANDKDHLNEPIEWDVTEKHLPGWRMCDGNLHAMREIEDGFIHVYLDIKGLNVDREFYFTLKNSRKRFMNKVYQAKPVVYLCEIPADTVYCRGVFMGVPAGCARKIKFIKKLEDYVFE